MGGMQPSCMPGEMVGGCFPALLQPQYYQMEDGVSVGIREDGVVGEDGEGGVGDVAADVENKGEKEALAGGGAAEGAGVDGGNGTGGKDGKARNDQITLLITCEDTGLGIPLASQAKIFQPFTQAESSTARTHGGTGIGLTISKRLVKLMGGDMTFVSEPGVGTTFVLTVNLGVMPTRAVARSLPMSASSSSAGGTATPGTTGTGPTSTAASTTSTLPPELVPMMDDDPDAEATLEKLHSRAVLVVDGLLVRQRVAASVLSRLGIRAVASTDITTVAAVAARGFYRDAIPGPQPVGQEEGGAGGAGLVSLEGEIRPWDAIFIDKDAFGPRTGFQVARMIRDALAANAAAAAAATAAAGGGAVGGGEGGEQKGGAAAKASGPPLILLACKLDAEEKVEAEGCGFVEKLFKPLRKSIVAACLIQVLGILASSTRSGNTEKQKRRKAMEALVGGRNILVVDDNLVNQKVAMRMLQRYGVISDAVDSGQAALGALEVAAAKGKPYDAVFMDVQMPGMDGYETTRAIRRKERETGARPIPIFAMTADVISGSRTRCEEAGMDGFVPKPIDEEQLHATLWNCFGRA
eukprot:TRINITY_DN9988_c0_g2_i1.p1 TRINITY_DN9988_c0_g2~~TRINITY_DN9988_c0_g2_i1.p1  ORF type:complete len:599 (-),score=50.64 TRINITY_DN9988_c0_g2_i1:277-2016(-)